MLAAIRNEMGIIIREVISDGAYSSWCAGSWHLATRLAIKIGEPRVDFGPHFLLVIILFSLNSLQPCRFYPCFQNPSAKAHQSELFN